MFRVAPPAHRPVSSSARPLIVLAPIVALALLLAACGGGGGGGGGGGSSLLHVLIVNHTQKDVNVTYSGGEPVASSQDKPPVKTCTAAVIDYPLGPDPFTVSIDGKVQVDSAKQIVQLENQGQADAVTQIDVYDDHTTDTGVAVGQFIQKPAQIGICIT